MIRSYTGFASKKQPVQHCNYVSTQTGMGRKGLVYPFALAPNFRSSSLTGGKPTPNKKEEPSDLRRDRQRCRQKPGASAKVPGSPGARVDAPRSPGASVNAPRLTGASANVPGSQEPVSTPQGHQEPTTTSPGSPGASVKAPGSPGSCVNAPR